MDVSHSAAAQPGAKLEALVRVFISEALREFGYETREASDAASGLRLLQSNTRFNLLITDVGLPGGMNGRQMVDAARGMRPQPPVLFVTGYAQNAMARGGFLAPGMEMINKPFALDALSAKISEMIEH